MEKDWNQLEMINNLTKIFNFNFDPNFILLIMIIDPRKEKLGGKKKKDNEKLNIKKFMNKNKILK